MLDNIISVRDAEEICRIDGKSTTRTRKADGVPAQIAPATKRFVDTNKVQVYYACNCWVNLLLDLGVPEGYQRMLASLIRRLGLSKVVGVCRELADRALEGMADSQLEGEHRWVVEYATSDASYRSLCVILDFIESHTADCAEEAVRKSLQFLLYLERFTYEGSASSIDASIQKFLAVNDRCREMSYDWTRRPSRALLCMMQAALDHMLSHKKWDYDSSRDCGFSSGSVVDVMRMTWATPDLRDKYKTPLGKWYMLSQYQPCLGNDIRYPFPNGNSSFRKYTRPVMVLVPKSFDSRRVIFPEDVPTSYYAHGALVCLRRNLDYTGTSKYINEDNQLVNRDFARIGSYDGTWATIDMSSASDSIPKVLAYECFPGWFVQVLKAFGSSEFEYPGANGRVNVRKLWSLFTSGNPLTWLVESLWFLALGRVAALLCGFAHPEPCVFVYGDDMIVRRECYDCTVELLERFGHTVNRRKSYGSGMFRESCGGWYIDGTDVTPTYWPRRAVGLDEVSTYSSLTHIQHSAIMKGFNNLSEFAAECMRALFPKVTNSSIGSRFSDIWDPSCDEYYDDTTKHTTVKEVMLDLRKFTSDWVSLAEHVAYYEYLMWGPSFDSELDRLLGTSSSRLARLCTYAIDYKLVNR